MKAGWIFVAVGVLLPLTASAQDAGADLRYCAELTRLYRTYVNNPDDPRPTFASPNVTHEAAIASCKSGNTAAGIPVLEQALRDNKLTLPQRTG
jgi:hypothetical protein